MTSAPLAVLDASVVLTWVLPTHGHETIDQVIGRSVIPAPNMTEVLSKSLNLTLWLADGDGHINRWATHDKRFLDPNTLRKVPSGHDSSWIAGQALGIDDLVVADLDSYPTRRWKSVLAMPVALRYRNLPDMSAGVITFGLPKPKDEYVTSMDFWAEPLSKIAESWATRISDIS